MARGLFEPDDLDRLNMTDLDDSISFNPSRDACPKADHSTSTASQQARLSAESAGDNSPEVAETRRIEQRMDHVEELLSDAQMTDSDAAMPLLAERQPSNSAIARLQLDTQADAGQDSHLKQMETERLALTDKGDRDDDKNRMENHSDTIQQNARRARSGREYPPGFLLSVVIPVFNEERTLETLIERVRAIDVPKEIVIVDDHSSDGTRRILSRYEQESNIHVIAKPTNQGKGAALRTGFAQACGDVIVIQDADLEYHPDDIPALLEPILHDEADVVYGSRFLEKDRGDRSRIHRWGNRLLTWASNRTTGLQLTDMETCYKAFRREAIRAVALEQDRFGFEPEVTAKLARRGYRFVEVPIQYDARGYDEGKKIGIRDLLNAFFCIWRYGHHE